MMRNWSIPGLAFLLMGLMVGATCAQQASESDEAGNYPGLDAQIQKVIEIGKNDNRVQQHLDYLTNRIGPRLTGSEGLQAGCEWARDEFKSMGLESRLEQWGEFPVGFERGPATGVMISPKEMTLEFGTDAWTAGTQGRVLGKAVLAPTSMEQLEEMRDTLKGAYIWVPRRGRSAPAAKKDDKSGEETDKEDAKPVPKPLTREQRTELYEAMMDCEPAGVVRGTSDNLILTGGSYRIDMDSLPVIPNISLLKEQWDEIKTLLDEDEDVQIAFDIRNHFREGPIPLFNVIAEIPGTEWPEERVVVGGHIDSWDGATGATDNGAGCATTLEAARILMAAGVKPRRTIRFVLWSGEEQGLLGSSAYVTQHKKDVNKNVSAVFVHDGGTNFVSGIRCTEAMRPDFEKVFAEAIKLDERAPFEIQVVESIRPRGGSDHVSYIRAGVPGFFWNQSGRATYRTTHHTQYDTFDSVVPEYQKHSSVVIALGALGTANLDHLLPRDGVQAQSSFSRQRTRASSMKPPVAKPIPTVLSNHGVDRTDNYYWLNQRENPEVISYLNSENAYTESMLADVKVLEASLFEEIKGRIKQDDSSVPYSDRGYVYYTRFEEGKQYPIHCRKIDKPDSAEEVVLNVNELAEGQPFCNVAGLRVSPDNKVLAFAVDFTGRRKYNLRFKDLAAGKLLDDQIENVTGGCTWANDSKTVFFTLKDLETLRAYKVVRHELGTPVDQDVAVYEEKNEEFSCGVGKSRSREFIMIESSQTLSSEMRYLSADDPHGEFTIFAPREPNHEYSVDHLGGSFYIRSNKDAKNFKLLTCGENAHQQDQWQEVIPHRKDVYLSGFTLFNDFLVLSERKNGLVELRIKSNNSDKDFYMPFEEPAYVAGVAATPDSGTLLLRYVYTSLTTPRSTFEFNMKSGEKKLLKQQEVVGDFNSQDYRTERVWATARDGVKVPVSIVYHKNTKLDGTAPCLEYGYGSYGASMDPSFSSANLSLLDRGFVYAIAHIRGGQEMGRQWYEDGKLLKKMNTFNDFIDVGKFLIEKKYSDPKQLYCRGGSAGGLLIGAVINLEPELYHGAIADVPFVDVVTTMLDDTIPLTTFEYDEWGNPNEKESFDYMLSYSPYDQVASANYPNLLVTTGLHDSQVQYFEPAKWVAKLRVMKQGDNLLLMKTNMKAGHGGASGRFDRFKETATRYAFLLKLAGIKQ
ncbi:MAG: oligopeptidase B [Mariniblastus sp.]|jgi:oligopeptidase B